MSSYTHGSNLTAISIPAFKWVTLACIPALLRELNGINGLPALPFAHTSTHDHAPVEDASITPQIYAHICYEGSNSQTQDCGFIN